MLSSAILVFREALEAALIITIVMAATRGVPRRGWWVMGGIAAGLCGSIVVAMGAGQLAAAAEGVGQELFNAGILLSAVLMLAWHNIWMAQHGREMVNQMKSVGKSVSAGQEPITVLFAAVGLAVLREGSEVVLFLYGVATGGESLLGLYLGGALGLSAAMVLGVILYRGLLNVPIRHFFTVTSWMVLLLAAGMASQAAHFLIQSGLLPPLVRRLWDSSDFISEQSLLGQLLHTLIGYDSRPSGMQMLFYVITLLIIWIGMKWVSRPRPLPVLAAA
jgi:high-affinity iron transporter